MRLVHELGYAKGAGWQAVELPYIGEELSMLIVLPDDGTDLSIGADAVTNVGGTSALRQVTLSLPKFDIGTSADLSVVLADMGMPTAFSDAADFSGMTTAEKLTISAVIHQANITVDEEGTEAAAATAVVMRTTSAPEPLEPVELIVDRPFVFAIRDNPTGALLFMGHIGDPTATRA
jgi:serpin B